MINEKSSGEMYSSKKAEVKHEKSEKTSGKPSKLNFTGAQGINVLNNYIKNKKINK